jgi:hypothetical protein
MNGLVKITICLAVSAVSSFVLLGVGMAGFATAKAAWVESDEAHIAAMRVRREAEAGWTPEACDMLYAFIGVGAVLRTQNAEFRDWYVYANMPPYQVGEYLSANDKIAMGILEEAGRFRRNGVSELCDAHEGES